jgi:hypothetical protein
VQQFLHTVPRQRVFHRTQDHRVLRAGRVAADQQFLEQLLGGT